MRRTQLLGQALQAILPVSSAPARGTQDTCRLTLYPKGRDSEEEETSEVILQEMLLMGTIALEPLSRTSQL